MQFNEYFVLFIIFFILILNYKLFYTYIIYSRIINRLQKYEFYKIKAIFCVLGTVQMFNLQF